MAGRKQSVLPAEIIELRERIAGWRRRRIGRRAMPEELWAEVEAAAQRWGVYAIARGVGIDYGTLAKRLKGEAQKPARKEPTSIQFVEWSGAEILGPTVEPGIVLEISDASGRQLSVRMSSSERLDLTGIVAAFCGARP